MLAVSHRRAPAPRRAAQLSSPSVADPRPDPDELARRAAQVIADRTGIGEHDVAVVLGSGWLPAVAALGSPTTVLPQAELPGFVPPTAPSAPTTAQHITVSKPAPVIPLSRPQVLDLLHHTPDYGPPGGPLGDPSRRTSCLSGLGYPASTPVLGAQPIDIDARPAVLLVIPADTPDKLAVFAVAPHCSAADTGLLASTVVPRA